jgi:REP element-mobilizing transposase RayT
MSTPPRLRSECYQGFGRFFLTICTYRRREWFASADCVGRVGIDLLRTSGDYRFDGIAYCFMRDHVHGLFESTAPDCDFRKFASMLKQRSAFAHKNATSEKLWQDGYFDRVLRREEATLDVVAYILENPVEAGLCRDSRDYPFIGSTLYSVEDLHDAVAARSRDRVSVAVIWRP